MSANFLVFWNFELNLRFAIMWLHDFALLNSPPDFHMYIKKRNFFTNVCRTLDEKHWPKDIVQNYDGHFLGYYISQYQKLLLLR